MLQSTPLDSASSRLRRVSSQPSLRFHQTLSSAFHRTRSSLNPILPHYVIRQFEEILGNANVSRYFLPRLVELIESLSGVSHLGSVADFHRSKGLPLHTDIFRVGDIVVIPFAAPCVDRRANIRDDKFVFSSRIGPLVANSRPAIIIARHQTSMTCLPVLTSHGRGFPEIDRRDCLWVRNFNLHETWMNDPTVSESLTCDDTETVYENSYIYLTRPYSVLDEYPVVKKGRLESRSTIYLEKKWQAANQRGCQAMNEKGNWTQHIEASPPPRQNAPFDGVANQGAPRSRKRRHSSFTDHQYHEPERRWCDSHSSNDDDRPGDYGRIEENGHRVSRTGARSER